MKRFVRPGSPLRSSVALRDGGWWLLVGGLGVWAVGGTGVWAEPARQNPVDWARALPAEGTGIGALPPLPEGFRRRRLGPVRWAWPEVLDEEVAVLQSRLPEVWGRLNADLGVAEPMDLVVRVARSPEEMAALAPRGLSPPGYAVGVAYPAMGVILLSAVAPRVRERVDLATTLDHELSHVALHRAVGGHRLPRWFVEGVAIHQAREDSLARTRLLWQAVAFGRPLPLRAIAERVRGEAAEVSLAYAQAADLVRFLRRAPRDRERFVRLVSALRSGRSFEAALQDAYSMNLAALEAAWHRDATERFGWLPMVLGGGSFWGLASVLLVLAWWRRRRAARERLERWAREEEAEARQAEAATEVRPPSGDGGRLVVLVRQEPDLPFLVGSARTPERDPDVPTVRWDGEDHTLH